MATPNRATILDYIGSYGADSGLTREQIQAAQAIAIIEGAGGSMFNPNDTGGTQDYGPFQFNNQGQLANFAVWAGVPFDQAGQYAIDNWQKAVQFALRPGGYLSTALQAGQAAGNTGPSLVLYGFKFGQVGILSSAQAINAWNQVPGTTLGSDVNSIVSNVTGQGETPQTPQQIAQSLQSVGQQALDALNALPKGAGDTLASVTDAANGIAKSIGDLGVTLGSSFDQLKAVGEFLGQPNLVKRFLLLVGGVLVAIVGLILFAISFVHLPGGARVG